MASQLRADPTNPKAITVGDKAPDASLTNSAGEAVRLSDMWADKPVVVVFLRHFGCTFCREQVALIRCEYQKILAAGMHIVCVANGPYKVGKAFEIYFDLPFPVLVSENAAPFSAYGLERVSISALLTPRVIIKGFVALLHGHIQGRIIGDPMQMPGTFIIDTRGIVQFVHRNRDAADHTKVADILAGAPHADNCPS